MSTPPEAPKPPSAPPPEAAHDPEAGVARGLALKIVSVLVFTMMSACIKAASVEAPAGEAVFFRSFFALVPLLAYMAIRRELPQALATRNPVGHVARGLVGVTAMGLGFVALGLLPLPEAIAIGYASPIFATLLAAAVLGETIRAIRIAAVAVGMAGVLIILWPKLTLLEDGAATSTETLGAFAALIGAFFGASAMVIVRRMVATERPSTIVFYFSVTASIVGLATSPFGWTFPSAEVWALLIGAGFLGGIGQILLTEAYKHAEASMIAPFEYSSMVFAVLLGWSVFDEIPTFSTLLGSAVVIAAGVLIIWRERQLGIERARARRAGGQ